MILDPVTSDGHRRYVAVRCVSDLLTELPCGHTTGERPGAGESLQEEKAMMEDMVVVAREALDDRIQLDGPQPARANLYVAPQRANGSRANRWLPPAVPPGQASFLAFSWKPSRPWHSHYSVAGDPGRSPELSPPEGETT